LTSFFFYIKGVKKHAQLMTPTVF